MTYFVIYLTYVNIVKIVYFCDVEMETNTIGWIGLISVLFITSFGVSWILTIVVGLILFVIGYASKTTSSSVFRIV